MVLHPVHLVPCNGQGVLTAIPQRHGQRKGSIVTEIFGGRGLHLAHLRGSPGVGNIHRQHENVLATTPGKMLQEDPLHHTLHSEADWCG